MNKEKLTYSERKGREMNAARYDKKMSHWVLWEDDEVRVVIQIKTNFPAEYGGHIVVEQKLGVRVPYGDYRLFAKMSIVAAAIQKGLEETDLAPHANIQSNANWAFREADGAFRDVEEGRKQRGLHIHVYGRTPKDPGWGESVRPAYHEEQRQGKYWQKVFSQEKMNELSKFFKKEIPTVLQTLKESF